MAKHIWKETEAYQGLWNKVKIKGSFTTEEGVGGCSL